MVIQYFRLAMSFFWLFDFWTYTVEQINMESITCLSNLYVIQSKWQNTILGLA